MACPQMMAESFLSPATFHLLLSAMTRQPQQVAGLIKEESVKLYAMLHGWTQQVQELLVWIIEAPMRKEGQKSSGPGSQCGHGKTYPPPLGWKSYFWTPLAGNTEIQKGKKGL